jgi:hypothetical protein
MSPSTHIPAQSFDTTYYRLESPPFHGLSGSQQLDGGFGKEAFMGSIMERDDEDDGNQCIEQQGERERLRTGI